MENGKTKKHSKRWVNILFRIVICLVVLLLGMLGMSKLASLKKPPVETIRTPRRLRVEAQVVQPEAVQMFITAYGEAKALNQVVLASEVSGKVMVIHPRLEVGEIITKDDILFQTDSRNYDATYQEARAAVEQWENTILRLKKQFDIDSRRLKTLQRNKDLANLEFKRIRKLFKLDSVGTRSGVDRAEQAYNASTDQADQMAQAVTLYPIRIKEAQSSQASAKARMALSKANLDRCAVTAPFDGRIKSVAIEKGQFVSPGQPVITLVDDSVLEILVPLDSRDVRKWLRFNNEATPNRTVWFSGLEKRLCTVLWTEDKAGHTWEGTLHRVVKFNNQTRTITIAIRVKPGASGPENFTGLPLVEGMFCEVKIPGKRFSNMYRIPRKSVSFENTVYVAVENKLKTLSLEVARLEGDFAYVSGGLKPGDRVITTRLIDPLENALLEISDRSQKEGSS